MGGCMSAPISVSDQEIRNMVKPPEPKTVVEVPNLSAQKSKKIIEDCLDDVTQTTSENTTNESEIINQIAENAPSRRNSLATNRAPDESNLTWSERRNSEKEKASFAKYKIDRARGELQKRLSLRTVTHSKCPVCGDLGPETSNQYYAFYLIVLSVICKTKCRRCNVYFSFEYVGMVKSLQEAVNLVLDEEL
jgi:hypothetical protein